MRKGGKKTLAKSQDQEKIISATPQFKFAPRNGPRNLDEQHDLAAALFKSLEADAKEQTHSDDGKSSMASEPKSPRSPPKSPTLLRSERLSKQPSEKTLVLKQKKKKNNSLDLRQELSLIDSTPIFKDVHKNKPLTPEQQQEAFEELMLQENKKHINKRHSKVPSIRFDNFPNSDQQLRIQNE
jgi:hypothetical protein